MAETKESDHLSWVKPNIRGLIPLDRFHIPRKLAQQYRNKKGKIYCDKDFEQVIRSCQEIRKERKDTWINDEILQLYLQLHQEGHAHSVEYWEEDVLLGALYGLHIGGVFFGESMFSKKTNASKFCLIKLVDILSQHKFVLLDAQFVNEHLVQFGLIKMPEQEFDLKLAEAIPLKRSFAADS